MKKKLNWFTKSLPIHLSNSITGWGNGYVVIPEGHPYYGKHYDDIPVVVHGGLTFSEFAKDLDWKELSMEDLDSGYVVGFDTAHYGDNIINCDENFVVQETLRLKKQLEDIWEK